MLANLLSIVLCASIVSLSEARSIPDTYDEERRELLNAELHNSLGGNLELTADELAANDILMQLKNTELQEITENPRLFNYTGSYLNFRKNIDRSRVYRIIKQMPKGAVLHIHASMMLDADSLIELTHEDNLYACLVEDDLNLAFSDGTPRKMCTSEWKLLSDVRRSTKNVEAFDEELKKYMRIDEGSVDADEESIWYVFDQIFRVVKALIRYKPMYEKYFYKALQSFYDDNVRYIELRGSLGGLYDLNGTAYDSAYTARLLQRIVKQFMEDHPDFIGAKWIVTINRKANDKDLKQSIENTLKLQAEMPDFIIGFDLVGREELGYPLQHYLPILKENRELVKYYFHSGETNWNGMDFDENLIDAVLLGTRRIAHGNALIKHPSLINIVKEKEIAVEVNPISNCVLGLSKDLRTHPLAFYLAANLPVVISSDDPGAWKADPVSHDYFVTFMLIANKHADLRLLKQLVLNSIKYSELENKEKTKFRKVFQKSWSEFVDSVNSMVPKIEKSEPEIDKSTTFDVFDTDKDCEFGSKRGKDLN